MILSKLYSNKEDLFESIKFTPKLNVVMAEIHLPKNKEEDTHNLGKSILCQLLDFVFLRQKSSDFFLFENGEKFKEFIFFLEVQLDDSSFLTIKRSVNEATRISFKKHEEGNENFSTLFDANDWDHFDIGFDKAKQLLDSYLNFEILKPWTYRNFIGYLLRSQNDYSDVFQLKKLSLGKHSNWKPFLAKILGFNGILIQESYNKEKELEDEKKKEAIVKNELGGSMTDQSHIEGMLLLKTNELEQKQKSLNLFDFREQDKEETKQLVEVIDNDIAELNQERYSLLYNKKKIKSSLKTNILFNENEVSELFKEAGILFEGQIKKDFEQLIKFNKAITNERRSYLEVEYKDITTRIEEINSELDKLGQSRIDNLSFLSETDAFEKYKKLSNELVIIKADIIDFEKQKKQIHRLQEIRSNIRKLEQEFGVMKTNVENNIETQNSDQDSLFSIIRLYFSEIIEKVINSKALLSVSLNNETHLEFKAEILDESGNKTSADLGRTYKKLLCIAFDLSILRAYNTTNFFRFTYLDGVFESLDDRKKINLLQVLREYSNYGVQPIITLIDSELPEGEDIFSDDELILICISSNLIVHRT